MWLSNQFDNDYRQAKYCLTLSFHKHNVKLKQDKNKHDYSCNDICEISYFQYKGFKLKNTQNLLQPVAISITLWIKPIFLKNNHKHQSLNY